MVTGWCQDCQDEWALEEMKKKGYNQSNYSADNETIPESLMKSAAEEMLAGDAYRVRADMAEEKGDSKSAALWRHIADEECCSGGSHFLEFNDRYNEIAEGGVPKEKPYRTRKGFWYDKNNIPMRDGTGKQKRNPPRELSADTEEMVLSFSDYKEGMLRWVARYPDKTMTVMVKDFNNNQPVQEEAMKAAFRYSKATINNIVTNHDLVYAGNDDNSIWFLTTIGNLPVEVQISDIENMKERRLEDIFNGAAAVIQEQLVPQRSTMTEKPEEMPERKDLPREFIADSAEYMADTITKSGWREKIDEAFQTAVERLKK
jgi:6-pyruvoyl-tetrahydropterin synthase